MEVTRHCGSKQLDGLEFVYNKNPELQCLAPDSKNKENFS